MKPREVLSINSKIEVALASTDVQIFGHSLIQEVFENSLSIMVPLVNGAVINLKIGDALVVSLLINKRRYIFETVVLENKSEEQLVVIKMPQKIIPADRRKSVRIKTLLPVKYEDLGTEQPEEWDMFEPSQEAVMTSLSGRGLVFSARRELEKGTILVLELDLESETIQVREKLLGEVVRCEQQDGRYQIGTKFLSIAQWQEDLIIKYVFHCLRKTIRLIRDDY